MPRPFEAVLILSFGGPEKPDDVMPFLEQVLRGRNVPRERLLEVAEHYYQLGGRSPINDQNRALIAALSDELRQHGLDLPVYWGNRNWTPFLSDTLSKMDADGIDSAAVFVTSAFSSYSGCRQYLEDMLAAQREVGSESPRLEKLGAFYDHPGFIETVADRINDAFEKIPPERREKATLLFTAHSIPLAMAENSPYLAQLTEASTQVARKLGRGEWNLVFQSRSGPPSQPWLEPDILSSLRQLAQRRGPGADVVVSPIGFISDHMEVVYDLDTEAQDLAGQLQLNMVRAGTPGVHSRFVTMIRELIVERLSGLQLAMVCAADCCPPPARSRG